MKGDFESFPLPEVEDSRNFAAVFSDLTREDDHSLRGLVEN